MEGATQRARHGNYRDGVGMLRGGELLSKNIDPRLGVTFGIVVLAAFVVVLAVSLATLGWSGPGEYRGVMLTLVVSLLVMIVAALAVAWVVASRKLPMGDAGTTQVTKSKGSAKSWMRASARPTRS